MKTIDDKHNSKNAYVEQIILWIVLFIGFVTLFFFIVEYSVVLKIIDKVDSLSDYGARALALGTSESEIVNGLNAIKGNFFLTITADNLSCSINYTSDNYQAVFNTYTTYENNFLINQGANNIDAKKVVFNESNPYEVVCNLYITVEN